MQYCLCGPTLFLVSKVETSENSLVLYYLKVWVFKLRVFVRAFNVCIYNCAVFAVIEQSTVTLCEFLIASNVRRLGTSSKKEARERDNI